MSTYFLKSSPQMNQQLKVQELVVDRDDKSIVRDDGTDTFIIIGEKVGKIYAVLHKKDSPLGIAPIASANITKVDSTTFTPAGDEKAIRIAGVVMAANESMIIKLTVQD